MLQPNATKAEGAMASTARPAPGARWSSLAAGSPLPYSAGQPGDRQVPTELGCAWRCAGHSSVEGHASTPHPSPRGRDPNTDPLNGCAGCAQLPAAQPALLQGKPSCPGPQTAPALPNPPAPGFPWLSEAFKSGLGSHHVLLISSGRSTQR